MSKTMIITGATSGIGFATFKYMLEKYPDNKFALIGRSVKELESFKSSSVRVYEFSLENLEQIPSLIDKIYADFGRIDYLFNIAGYTDPASLLETTIENLQKTYNVNVFAPIILMRECVKYMKLNNESKILNVASTAGITPRPGWLSYASSKAAVVSINSTLSQELAEYGIKMYCISPGRCATALRRKLAPEEDQSKIMQPIDVAKVIYNLMNEDECCLDGQNIVVRKK